MTRTANATYHIEGQRFGRLTVLSLAGIAKSKKLKWLCQCDCGNRKVVKGVLLRSGNTRSCGCLRQQTVYVRTALSKIDPLHRFVCADPNSGCWLWTGNLNNKGYGQITYWVDGKQNSVLAHRASYEQAYGTIPSGLFACHRCDTPACVRPDHLFLGTAADNISDMIQKGRAAWQREAA